MMGKVLLVGIAAAILGGCHQPASAIAQAQCPAWKNIDLHALPTHLNDDPADANLEDILTAWSGNRQDVPWRTISPTAFVHIQSAPGMTANPRLREVTARRSAGNWEVYARSKIVSGPHGPWTAWEAVRLSPNAEHRLEAILENPCLWSAPRFLGGEVRLLNGRYDSRPDGPIIFYDIGLEGRRWKGGHFSWVVGPPGEAHSLLLAEAFGLPDYPPDEIDSYGWLDKPS